MADRIRVQTEQMEELSSQMARLSSALHEIESQIRGVEIDRISGSKVKVQLPGGMLNSVDKRLRSGDTDDCLKRISSVLGDVGRYAHEVSGNIVTAAETFAETERWLVWQYEGLMSSESSVFQNVCKALNFTPDRNQWTPEMHKRFRKLINEGNLVMDGGVALLIHSGVNYIFDKNGLLASFEQKSGLSGSKQTSKLYTDGGKAYIETESGLVTAGGKYKTDLVKQNKIDGIKEYYDKNGNPVSEKDLKKLGKKVDVLSIGKSYNAGFSVLNQHGAVQGEHGKAEGDIGIMNAEVHGNVQGGLGVYLPGKDGKSELYLGIDAEMGMSASALELKGSAEYELCDAVELSAEGDVSIFKGSAEAAAGVGIVGGELMAYAKAGAEFNVVEANGEVGVDIGGIKGTVGGGVQVGVGANAEVGYKDGVFMLDVGVSLGVGVSFNVELDVGGAIDNIGNALEDVGDAIQSFSEGLTSFCAWWR